MGLEETAYCWSMIFVVFYNGDFVFSYYKIEILITEKVVVRCNCKVVSYSVLDCSFVNADQLVMFHYAN